MWTIPRRHRTTARYGYSTAGHSKAECGFRLIGLYGQFMNQSHGPDPEHSRLLGEAIIAWSKVSEKMETLFVDLANLDDPYVVGVFVKRIRDAQLDEVVHDLAGQLEAAESQAIRSWVREVGKVRKLRNAYLHSVFSPIRHSDGRTHLYLQGQRLLNREDGTATTRIDKLLSRDLLEFASQALSLQQSFDELRARYRPFHKR